MKINKKLIPLLFAVALLSLPVVSTAQVLGVHVFASRTSVGMLVMDESYNATSEVYSIVFGQAPPGSPSYKTWNIGLGFVEVVFSRHTYPKGLEAYIEVDGEPLVDMLINFTIQNYQHEFPNGTRVQAKYVSAFIYLFANHSITNESTIEPVFEPASYSYDSSHILAGDSQMVLAQGEIQRVKVAYSMSEPVITTETPTTTTSGPTTTDSVEGPDLLVIGVVVGVIIIAVITLVWYKRR